MTMAHIEYDTDGKITSQELIMHSIHNTGNPTTKVAVIPRHLYNATMHQFSVIHSTLQQYVTPEYHGKVFIPGKNAGPTGQKADSIPSCTHSAMADRLLASCNPQDGEKPITSSQPKRPHHIPISYSRAISGSETQSSIPEAQIQSNFPSVSTITDQDLDSIYICLLPRLSVPSSAITSTVTTEDLECHYNKCQLDITTIRSDLTMSTASIQPNIAKVKTDMEKQNAIILGMHQEVTAALQDFA